MNIRVMQISDYNALKACGIVKAALVAFSDNQTGNAFWERMGFTERRGFSLPQSGTGGDQISEASA